METIKEFRKSIDQVNHKLLLRGYSHVKSCLYAQSRQAVILLVEYKKESNLNQRFILKIFTRNYRHNSPEGFKREVMALRKFHAALEKRNITHISCPRVIIANSKEMYYVMSYLEGGNLDDYLARANTFNHHINDVTDILIEGISIFYDAVGQIYGDFQPKNIIIGNNWNVGFVDPTIPNPFFGDLHSMLSCSYGAADFGYWLYSVAIQSAKYALVDIFLAIKRIRFTVQLLRKTRSDFSQGQHDFIADVVLVTKGHLRRMKAKSRSLKTQFLIVFGKIIIKYVLARLNVM